jgi:hypothetical protein
MKSTKTLKIDVPINFKLPTRLEENNPEVNAEILTLGNGIMNRQEELIFEKVHDEEIHKLMQSQTVLEKENKCLKEETEKLKRAGMEAWSSYYAEGREIGKKDNEQFTCQLRETIIELKETIVEERQRNKELRENYNAIINEVKGFKGEIKELETFISKFSSSSAKIGSFGEEFVEDYFSKNFNSFNTTLNVVSKQKGKADLRFTSGDLKLLIEVKNENIVTKNDINKFIEDVQRCGSAGEINAGIFISLRDTYLLEGKKGFYIDFIQNIPVIYISDVIRNPDIINTSVNILGHLVNFTLTKKGKENEDGKTLFMYQAIVKIHSKFQATKQIQVNHQKYITYLQEQCKLLDFNLNDVNQIFEEIRINVPEIQFDKHHAHAIKVGTGEFKNADEENKKTKLKKEIYDKVKASGCTKVSKKSLMEMGFTERQIRDTVSIRKINNELFNSTSSTTINLDNTNTNDDYDDNTNDDDDDDDDDDEFHVKTPEEELDEFLSDTTIPSSMAKK